MFPLVIPESMEYLLFHLQRLLSLINQDDYFVYQMKAATENSVRVKLMYEFMETHDLFPRYQKKNKSKTASTEIREAGNKLYVQKKVKESLELFNKAIAFAPKGSQELAFGYGNRSAALYELNLFEQCLQDISRARKEGYVETINTKLITREISSERNRAKNLPKPNNTRNTFLFSLITKRNTKYPCASDDLQISFDPKYGRGVIATQDISPGTILVIEEPYSALIEDTHHFTACYGCCSLNCALIPCEFCTFAMFCNEECRSRAWDQYHKYECPLMDTLIGWKLNSMERLALRTVLKARYDHKSWDDLFVTIIKAERKKDLSSRGSVKTDSAGSSQRIYDTKQYTPIHMLESNVTKEHILETIHKCTVAATMINKLKECTTLFCKKPESNGKNPDVTLMYSVGGLILHQLMISKTNAQNIEVKSLNTGSLANPNRLLSDTFAMGMYEFLGLMNHSCNPNVELLSVNTTKVALVLSPIKKGEQVFKSYDLNYWTRGYEIRQKKLKTHFKFKCECEACVNRWPIFSKLQEGTHPTTNIFENLDVDIVNMFDDEYREDTLKCLNLLCEEIKKAHKNEPDRVVVRLKLLLVAVWDMFGNHDVSKED